MSEEFIFKMSTHFHSVNSKYIQWWQSIIGIYINNENENKKILICKIKPLEYGKKALWNIKNQAIFAVW